MRQLLYPILFWAGVAVPPTPLAGQTPFEPPRIHCDRIDQCANPFIGGWGSTYDFVQYFVGELRAGDGPGAAEWEIGIVNATNTATYDEVRDHSWTPSPQVFTFAYDPSLDFAGIAADVQYAQADVGGLVTRPVNTLLIRAATSTGTVARLDGMGIFFSTGEALFLAALEGDLDGEYFAIQDDRLADGFVLAGEVALEGGLRSRPAVQFKVGTSEVVPEPAAVLLLATGLLGVAGAARLRRRREG